jgi:hypothetical protein
MVVEEKGNQLGIKGLHKKKKLKQFSSCYTKFFKDKFIGDGVEGICNIHM